MRLYLDLVNSGSRRLSVFALLLAFLILVRVATPRGTSGGADAASGERSGR